MDLLTLGNTVQQKALEGSRFGIIARDKKYGDIVLATSNDPEEVKELLKKFPTAALVYSDEEIARQYEEEFMRRLRAGGAI